MPSKWSEIRNNLNLTQEEWDKIEAEKSLIREQVKQRKERRMSEVRLIDANALFNWGKYKLSGAVKYGNKDEEQQHFSYSTLMMYEIADEIDSAPTIAPVRGNTNADRIRSMTDDELAGFIRHLDSGLDEICEKQDPARDGSGCKRYDKCHACYRDWLQQPAKMGGEG